VTFADAAGQMGVRDSGRSRSPLDDRDRFATERLNTKVTNWRWLGIHREIRNVRQARLRGSSGDKPTSRPAC